MKKLLLKLAVFLFKRIYKGENKRNLITLLLSEIKQSYQERIREEFEIQREIVQVKKGKVRYHVIYLQKNGKKTRVQISRHLNSKVIETVI